MSTLPESLEKRKINISMMLKVPIDIEIEVLALPATNEHQSEDKKVDEIFCNITQDSEPEVVISEASLAGLDENSKTLMNQIVNQLEQTDSLFSILSPIQYESQIQDSLKSNRGDKSEDIEVFSTAEYAAIPSKIQPQSNKNMLTFLDSFNDSFAFIANMVGTVLFLGKIVNYSWD
ncbi:hypothetical protein [Calothrix sp. PCC 6303]|uniref:hypothetical protein n=1 Tax=Calothrix sp. PCC 6303 TaxID=1170562 RepID=UPI0002A0119C|nr:hypothetical protein [Calothrix sp. PCC 6303]AFY99579.1 hypothetical protein Cal6303_0505 [Calothrix sp. PCC 6303]